MKTITTTKNTVSKELAIPDSLQQVFGKGAITLSVLDKALSIVESAALLNDSKKLLSFLVKENNGSYYMQLLNEAQTTNSPFLPRLLQFNTEYLSRSTSDLRLPGFSPSKKTDKKTGLITWQFKPVSEVNEQKSRDKQAGETIANLLPETIRTKLLKMPRNSFEDAKKFLEACRSAQEKENDLDHLESILVKELKPIKPKVISPEISEGTHKINENAQFSKEIGDKMYSIYQQLLEEFTPVEMFALYKIIGSEIVEFKKQA